MRRVAFALVALGSLALDGGCFGARSYACDDRDQCVVDGVQGMCEAAGFCSFPDEACMSGRRFSPFAGDGLARDCVEADAGTTSSVGSTPTTTADVDVTTSSDASTGCTTACGEPGWSWTYRDAALGVGRAHGVARSGARVIVVGGRDVDAARTEAFVTNHDAATGERDAPFVITADDEASGVATAVAANVDAFVVAGYEATDAGLRAFVARYDGDALAWIRRHDTLLDDEYRGVGLDGTGRAIAVGRSGDDAIVHAFDAAGDDDFARTIAATPPATAASLHAIAVAPGGTSWIAGAIAQTGRTSDAWARRLQPDGGTAFEFIDDDPAATPDIARTIAGLPDGGFVVGGVVATEGWLARVAAETSQSARVLDDGEVTAVAIAPDGSIVVTGWIAGDGRDVWLAGYSAALDPSPVWTTTVDHAALDDEGTAVAVADDGVVLVAGYATDAEGAASWLGAYVP